MANTTANNKTTPAGITPPDPNASLKFLWIAILALFGYLMIYNNLQGSEEDANAAPVESTEFDAMAWFNGVYQDKTEAYLKNDSKIGKELLPLKNQIDFDVFDKYNVEDYVMGNKGFQVGEANINAYLGKDYYGDSIINATVNKLSVVNDTLKNKGISLIMIFAPTKEYFDPSLIPAKYLKYKKRRTNYEAYLAQCQQKGILTMDMLPILKQAKTKYPYPIYPQYGTHPSYFSECILADTIIRFIEHVRGVEMPHIAWNEVDYPSEPRVRDGDVIGKAKLKTIPASIPLAYPRIGYTGTANAQPVKTLGIGDSYYKSLMYLGVMQNAFDNGEYWYYYNSILPETPDKKEVWEFDLKKKLEENKVILIYYSSYNLFLLNNGFINDAYQLYTDPKAYYARIQKETPVKQNIKTIHQDTDLLDEAQADAKNKNITLDSAIRLKAIQMLNN
jgi:hypothetical protein